MNQPSENSAYFCFSEHRFPPIIFLFFLFCFLFFLFYFFLYLVLHLIPFFHCHLSHSVFSYPLSFISHFALSPLYFSLAQIRALVIRGTTLKCTNRKPAKATPKHRVQYFFHFIRQSGLQLFHF